MISDDVTNNDVIYIEYSTDGSDISMYNVTTEYRISTSVSAETKLSVGPSVYDHQWTPETLSYGPELSLIETQDEVILTLQPMKGETVSMALNFSQVVEALILLDAYNRQQDTPISYKRFVALDD